ncbi:hypothetical protein JEQ12_016973 [Ovis aries]|uniref:Ribosomal protein L10e/L16 domain-containing protein n=1 Tax=Ovis aries TaxID=9940 RepID=A0A836D3G2_SHEEP|nr:hypothetical protein JEQ12_016973 [Ovis aries]
MLLHTAAVNGSARAPSRVERVGEPEGYNEDDKFLEASTLKKMKVDEGDETVVSPLLYASAFLPGKWAEMVQGRRQLGWKLGRPQEIPFRLADPNRPGDLRPCELEENGDTGSSSLQMGKARTRQDLSKVPSVPTRDSPTPAAFLRTTGKDVFLGPQTDPGWPLRALPTTFLQSGGPCSVDMESRLQTGMRGAFGKPQGTVARVHIGQVIMSIRTKLQNKEHVIEALRRAKFKFPGRQKIHISKKWGFTKFNADEFENMVAEKRLIPDGCGVKYIPNRGPLDKWRALHS